MGSRPAAGVRGRSVVVSGDETVGRPCCDRKAEAVTRASCSTCTGGGEKVARGSGVSCGGVDGSNVSVDEGVAAGDGNWRSEESNKVRNT